MVEDVWELSALPSKASSVFIKRFSGLPLALAEIP